MISFTDAAFKVLSIEEGSRDRPYDCGNGEPLKSVVGHTTIGIGHNLDANPLSQETIRFIFIEDLSRVMAEAITVFGEDKFKAFGFRRSLAITGLLFHLGLSRFLGFKEMISAIKSDDWDRAILEMRDSKMGRDPKFQRRLNRTEKLMRDEHVPEYGV